LNRGKEKFCFEDPLAGGTSNSMRYFGLADCDETLKTNGNVDNLFVAVEKAGVMVGHTEAIVTGSLAAYNVAYNYLGKPLLKLPDSLILGDFINNTVKK
jgi:folate-dependent tRNA-U54 methylase TrmFO/GidA